jgi:uncharacterized protein YhfF
VTPSDRTTLRPVDREAAQNHWRSFKRAHGLDDSLELADAFQFGDSYELANELADLVVNGPKRATCGSIAELETMNEPMPEVGDHWIVCDGSGRPVAVIRTTDVRVGPLSSVDDEFAWDEGEGDRSRADWLGAHTRYFTRALAAIGHDMHADIEVVFERFELL